MSFIGDGSTLTGLDAGDISAGTLSTARLSGTYNISISGNAATATTASNGGVTSVNGSTGAVTISAGNMSYDTQTGAQASNFNLGTYLVISWNSSTVSIIRLNQQITLRNTANNDYAATPTYSAAPNYGGNSSYAISGTWSFKGAIAGYAWLNGQYVTDKNVGLVQRVA